jgi:hypothetical protein
VSLFTNVSPFVIDESVDGEFDALSASWSLDATCTVASLSAEGNWGTGVSARRVRTGAVDDGSRLFESTLGGESIALSRFIYLIKCVF